MWGAELARDPQAFDAAWKLARADYWLGGHAPEAERRAFLEHGVEAGRTAVALQPNRAEGHFWTAANMGALAESFGLRHGLKYRKAIKAELEAVLRIDPAFQQGSADCVLGRWYFKVPALVGGSRRQAEQHLRAALTYNPRSTIAHFYLAELLLSEGRKDDARAELLQVIDAPLEPDWAPEGQEFKDRAIRFLARLK